MNEEYLARAKDKFEELRKQKNHNYDVRLFINGVCKRAEQLSHGAKRLVPTLPEDERTPLDIALLEVAEGKVMISSTEDEDAEAQA